MRKARLYDGVDDAGTPYFAPDRRRIADAAERERIAGYLRGGGAVMATLGLSADVVEPARGKVVPMSYLTDGTWIWSAALGYYARTHGIAPEAEFVEHMRGNDFVAPAVDATVRRSALDELRASWAALRDGDKTVRGSER
jgi:hypothetical protein